MKGQPRLSQQDASERQLEARERAARLQAKIGHDQVSAGSSNGWKGSYAIVDWDTLEWLAARASVEHRGVTATAFVLDDPENPDHVWVRLEVTPAPPGLHEEAYLRIQKVPS